MRSRCWPRQLPKRRQDGAVLIVCLIILMIMTLVGVGNIQTTSMQIKMAAKNHSRQVAFQAAETALSKVERLLQSWGHRPGQLQACPTGASDCYDSACGGGKCFVGSYPLGGKISDCSLRPVISFGHYWIREDIGVWNDPSKHQTVNLESVDGIPDPKYIVEFMCYIDKDENPVTDCRLNPATDCAALFRITTLATSENQQGRVMLQSTFKLGET